MSRIVSLALLLTLIGALILLPDFAHAQECPEWDDAGPNIPSAVRTLEGDLIYHDGIRRWFELRLDRPQCEQSSIQLVSLNDDWKPIEILRGCRVKTKGHINFSGTGYYSLGMYQVVTQIEEIAACARQSPIPGFSNAIPDASIQEYRVDMQVHYGDGDHPIIFRITSKEKELHPWQAYADYHMTGSFILYGRCGKGFVIDTVFGTPEANPSHLDDPRTIHDRAAFDPESAAASGKLDLQLGYTCVRSSGEDDD